MSVARDGCPAPGVLQVPADFEDHAVPGQRDHLQVHEIGFDFFGVAGSPDLFYGFGFRAD